MKKIIALLLVAAMCFSLAACGGGNDTPTADNNNEQQTNESGTQQEDGNNSEDNSAIQGKTLVVVGEEYITKSNNVFNVSKIELTDENNATFHFYISFDNKSDENVPIVTDITAYVDGKEIRFGFRGDETAMLPNACAPNSTNDIHLRSNCVFDEEYSFDKVEAAAKQNGIICFIIEETEYYIEMETFLNSKV